MSFDYPKIPVQMTILVQNIFDLIVHKYSS